MIDIDGILLANGTDLSSIREFKDRVGWKKTSVLSKIFNDVNVIREFADCLNWTFLSQNKNFNLKYLKEFKDRVNWYWISRRKDLTEDMIDEFYDQVDWEYLYEQKIKLSNNFLIKHNKRYFGK